MFKGPRTHRDWQYSVNLSYGRTGNGEENDFKFCFSYKQYKIAGYNFYLINWELKKTFSFFIDTLHKYSIVLIYIENNDVKKYTFLHQVLQVLYNVLRIINI